MGDDERDAFLRHELFVEEKVDGANLGISFDSSGNLKLQSRGAWLEPPYRGQWASLAEWLSPRTDRLFSGIDDRYVIFGEWCFARHTVRYTGLTDWFLGFDILEIPSGRFLATHGRDETMSRLPIAQVPFLAKGHFSLDRLTGLLGASLLGNGPAEGVYLRFNSEEWLGGRAKLVAPGFVSPTEPHWSSRPMAINQLKGEMDPVWTC
jgi:hypothetical protein